MKSSFPRQLSISAAVLVLSLIPLLYAGVADDKNTETFTDIYGISDKAADFTIYSTIEKMDLYSPEDFIRTVVVSDLHDIGYVLYDDDIFRDQIISYYAAVSGSYEIAEAVLRNAHKNDISFGLAFSLMWAESSFNPDAYNRNVVSIDRGLFQLNSESFPQLSRDDFYDIETNVSNGLAYLRYCLDLGENEIVALAIYNAGHGRVSGRGAPLMTLEYISKILEYKSELERDFERYISQNGKIRADKKSGKNLIPVVDTRKTLK
ncbi:MAG: lytic transglycosylase domain-containing protein [Spirochaetales bacterium]|uniref:Lytic transglycosylase domain-containing protein n=1 Tax=Candidatus Thalassospirochaeta sargassi TaxID=3119039 RepID=A0AAJ1IFH7_9SPIO|nr:lytic transglycosylase domain-containing protein [Spirochaetales bacterium]